MTKSQPSEINKQEGDAKVSDKSAKLKNILDKIRQNNNNNTSEAKSGLSLKSSGRHSDDTIEKFSPIKFGEQIVGETIIKRLTENCKGMIHGVVEEKIIPNS